MVDVYTEAREQLQLSSLPTKLPCRDYHRREVKRFIFDGLTKGGVGAAMYISGVPGTGKTATVLGVINRLENPKKGKNPSLPPFKVICINGMKLPKPNRVYVELYKAIFPKERKISPEMARKTLKQHLCKRKNAREYILVVVDELDLLVTKKQDVLYNLFDWSMNRNSKFSIIGIANTLDLPQRFLPRVSSRIGMRTLAFSSYTVDELNKIVTDRLSTLRVFDTDAVKFCATKIAIASGDARRALRLCSRATEFAKQEWLNQSNIERKKGVVLVGARHVEQALDEMKNSITITAIQSSSLMEKIFMAALAKGLQATGTSQLSFADISDRFLTMCQKMETSYEPNYNEQLSICNRLVTYRLLRTDSIEHDRLQQINFCSVTPTDIYFALKDDKLSQLLI